MWNPTARAHHSRAQLLLLATAATIIASQSIISGAFSITQQAIQLGYLPRMTIRHMSASERGQVYAPSINLLLFIAVVALVLGFRSSAALAAAFGLAVTATMVLTTVMIGYVMFRIWRWNPVWMVPLFLLLLVFDIGLFAAALTKFMDGGWLSVLVAALLIILFSTWHRGRAKVAAQIRGSAMPVDLFLSSTAAVPRIAGTAIYLTSSKEGIPPALLHNLKINRILHERILLVTVETLMEPYANPDERIIETMLAHDLSRIIVRYGFFESPDIPRALAGVKGVDVRSSFFLSRQTLVPARRGALQRWQDRFFSLMSRNAEHPMTFFRLPTNRVVELGMQIEI